ncbi:MAG: hypothetical protein K9H26_10825 [Prolixibacteraceae bacterium]|nr:hypothetical protein [Prolixibacteraceae bacterium]
MNKVLKFGYNIGINKNLTVCFGDRGIPGSLAHYNAASLVININRFERGTQEDKEIRFLTTGGIHSFAHEYGHFLDFFAGSVLEPQKAHFSCSGGHSIRRSKMGYNSPMREQFDIILDKIIFANGKLSAYYQNLLKKNLTEYWFRRTELFARAFEVYIANELNQIGIKNKFLTKPQYEQFTYISTQQLQSVLPNFRKLISLIRKKIQK